MTTNIFDFYNVKEISVIPILPGKKATTVKRWQYRRPDQNDASEFLEDCNFGVVLGEASNNWVDIDLDTPLAIKLAPHFLPPTGMIFGRQTAPRSHYIFQVEDQPGGRKKFSVAGKTFCEYRADSCYTVFPPSIHEGTGEQISFATQGGPGLSTREELLGSLSLMSIGGVVFPYYQPGQRHDLVLSLSGGLLSQGKTLDQVNRLFQGLCGASGDEELSKRLCAVKDTAEKLRDGQLISGWPRVSELIGKDAASDLTKLLGSQSSSPPRSRSNKDLPSVMNDHDKNDTGIAKLFSQKVTGQFSYHPGHDTYYHYNDGIWKEDERSMAIIQGFDEFITTRIDKSRDDKNIAPNQLAKTIQFLLKYRNRSNSRNAIDQARPYLAIPKDALGEKDDQIGVGNGLLNLRDGTLLPYHPEQYVLKQTKVPYDPSGDCPLFKALLAETFEGDDELISYFQGICGYWLTGRTDRQEFYILHGSGANGKSTILNAVAEVLGPFAGTVMSETIFEGSGGQQHSDLASVIHHRLVVVHEAQSKFKLNSPRMKQLSGQDEIKAKQLYKDPITFKPKFKIVIICNRQPNLDSTDKALLRRIKLIPFNNVVPKAKRDPKLPDKLRAEASGILNFLVAGARMYFEDRIREPGAVTTSTDTYFRTQDSVLNFLIDTTEKGSQFTVSKSDLYDAYRAYCDEEMTEPLSKKDFCRSLIEQGFGETRTSSARCWKGLRLMGLKTPPDPLPFPG